MKGVCDMANYVTVTSDKHKRTAFWLCLLGGYFGLHLFYVGRIGKGILYFCTFGCLFRCYWHDLGEILSGKFKDNVGQYLRE